MAGLDMVFYMIRHKASGEMMPELKRGKGYSYWNPSKVDTEKELRSILLGVPRLISSRRKASHCIIRWNAMPNAKRTVTTSYFGEQDDDVETKPDGRSKDDLEIVEVEILERIPM